MLHQQLVSLDAQPFDRGLRWLVPALVALAAGSGAGLLWLLGEPLFAALFLLACGLLALLGFAVARRPGGDVAVATVALPDYQLVGATLELIRDPAALTHPDGSLLLINSAYRRKFGDAPPLELEADDAALQEYRAAAWRDGSAEVADLGLCGVRVALFIDLSLIHI